MKWLLPLVVCAGALALLPIDARAAECGPVTYASRPPPPNNCPGTIPAAGAGAVGAAVVASTALSVALRLGARPANPLLLARPANPRLLRMQANLRARMLRSLGLTSPVTRLGLRLDGTEHRKLTRYEHLMLHYRDDSSRTRPHGVWMVEPDEITALMDQAYEAAMNDPRQLEYEGDELVINADLGRNIGWIGGSQGPALGYPRTSWVRLVIKEPDFNVITFYPLYHP
ncbi:MAG: hypothetical protein E6J41_31830 [Chloroflexi bacterium]|nr:MAG: hypothetical protein E6J41_31830 [Chloroflexota bacterium]